MIIIDVDKFNAVRKILMETEIAFGICNLAYKAGESAQLT